MQYQVIEKYDSAYSNPIKFKAGETLRIGTRDDEYEGWIRVTTMCGNEGWAPEQYINNQLIPPQATRNYDATELSTESGQILNVLDVLNDWAWAKNLQGQCGWVPCKTLERNTNSTF